MVPVWHFLNGLPTLGAPVTLGPLAITSSAVTSTVPIVGPAGAVGSPSFKFSNGLTTGFWSAGSNDVVLSTGGTAVLQVVGTGFRMISTEILGWSSGDPTVAAADVELSRGAANVLTLAAGDSFDVLTGEIRTAGNRVGYNLSAYGVGTAYALTNTAAAIDFGTTDPVIVLDKAGTYLILGHVNLAYNAATVAAETASIKVRRTNNTAADLSVVPVLDLPTSTLLTHTYEIVPIPPFVYTTTATDDSITLFANVSAALSAGSIDATAIGTSIVAVRLY